VAGACVAPACDSLLGDPDRVIALELVGGTTRTIAVGETLQLVVRAITASGDTAADAAIVWEVLDTGIVGFSLESSAGRVIGTSPDTGRVQASYENLRSDPVRIIVRSAAAAHHRPGPAMPPVYVSLRHRQRATRRPT
jgi:hypothetical protein